MSLITKVDKNFEIKTTIDKEDIRFYNIDEAPFKIYGIFKEDGMYRRMPEKIAKSVSEGVHILHSNTTGGRVRFITNSSYVAINTSQSELNKVPHATLISTIGFDLYAGEEFKKSFIPVMDMTDGFERVIELGNNEEREITINFPRECNVKEVYIGLQEKATLKEPTPYKNEGKPIVYYGSSITYGGCASRPGMTYQNQISRRFNYDYINLGFAGSALGEQEMADYIKTLDMSAFVLDYDYNAPSAEHLKNTHETFFKTIREAHPDLPVIMMSRPKYELEESEIKRLGIIQDTYNNAVNSGDKNVYIIDGRELMSLCGFDGTVDGAHPNDAGFVSMAKAVGDVIEKIKI